MTLRAALVAVEARVEAFGRNRLTENDADFIAHARTDLPRLVQGLRLAADALTVMSRNRVYGASARKALAALDALMTEEEVTR